MSGVDFDFPGFQQGNHLSPYPLQQQVFTVVNANEFSSKDKPNTENCNQGFNFWNEDFPPSSYDDIFIPTLDANGQPAQAPAEANMSNLSNLPPALPAPISTQPPADPALTNNVNVVGPWSPVPMAHATSTVTNEANLAALNALDPAQFMALVAASNAMQVPATNEPFELGLPNTETNTQGGTSAFVNQTPTYAPQVNAQVPQFHQPQPLLNPELGNGGGNNSAPNLNMNRVLSMGMAADGGFTPPPTTARPSPGAVQRHAQRRQALRVAQAQAQIQPQRLQAPQSIQGPRPAQFVQNPQLGTQYLFPQTAMNGVNTSAPQSAGNAQGFQSSHTPAMVMNGNVQNSSVPSGPATFLLLPPSMAIPPGNQTSGQYPNVLTTNGTPHLLAAQPNHNFQSPLLPDVGPAQAPNAITSTVLPTPSTSVNPRTNDDMATFVKFYAQKAFEYEGEKKKNEILQAQLRELQERVGKRSGIVPLSDAAAPPPVQPRPVLTSSTMVSTRPIASASVAAPPQQSLTGFQLTSQFAGVEQTYDFDQPSGELATISNFDFPSTAGPDFAPDFETVPPPQYSAVPFEEEWQQSIDFNNIPQMTLDLSQQQQQNFAYQAHAYPEITGQDQLLNRGPEEHHLGTLHQRQVEQVHAHGNLPQGEHNLTNGNHYHHGYVGAASSSSSPSKRKRDEAEWQTSTQKGAGDGPSLPKRQRTRRKENTAADKGKGREVVEATMVDRNPQSASWKRKRDEAGDHDAESSGSARPRKKNKSYDPLEGGTETLPMEGKDAVQYLLKGRLCEWLGEDHYSCDHPIEPREGAYWDHVKAYHNPPPCGEKGNKTMCECNKQLKTTSMPHHLDTQHVGDKMVKCAECGKRLKAKVHAELENHIHTNTRCKKGSKKFTVLEPAATVVLKKSEPPEGLSQKVEGRHLAQMEKFREDIARMNKRSQKGRMWGMVCDQGFPPDSPSNL